MQVISKKRIHSVIGLLLIISTLISCNSKNNKARILLVTGGHDFDTTEFYGMFASFSEYDFDTLSQPLANKLLAGGIAKTYDAIVFYDSWQTVSEEEKNAYLQLTEIGTGLLFLHHSLVSYQEWDEFSNIRGGRYPKTNPPDSLNDGHYRHDIDLAVTVLDSSNSVTKGMFDFIIRDEGYSNIIVKEDVTPLLKTNHPDCSEVIAWTHKYNNSKVVYLMGGHDIIALRNKNYARLIGNSLKYLNETD
jgi:type 1 glutamine amidotransferase